LFVFENIGFSERPEIEPWKMSQEPQKSAPKDVKLSGKNNLGERGGSPAWSEKMRAKMRTAAS